MAKNQHSTKIRRDTSTLTPLVWTLGIFIALTVLVAPYGQTASGYNPDYRISAYYQMGLSILLVFYFIFIWYKGKSFQLLLPRTPLLIPLLLFVLWMAISLFWATSLFEGFVKIFDWTTGLLLFLLVLFTVRTISALRILMFCLFMSGLCISVLAIMQFLFSYDGIHQHAAPAATFGNKNMASQYIMMIIPLSFGLLFSEKKIPLVWLYAIGASLMWTMLFYAHARSSFFATVGQMVLLAIIFVYAKLRYRHLFNINMQKAIAMVTSILLFSVMIFLTPHTFSEGTGGIDKKINPKGQELKAVSTAKTIEYLANVKNKGDQRSVMRRNSVEILKDNFWLGTGIGNWMVFYPKYQRAVKQDKMLVEGYYHLNTHNDYLEFAVELGIIGILLMIWMVGAIVLSFWNILNSSTIATELRPLMYSVIVSIVGVAVVGMASFPLQQMATIALVTVLLASTGVVYHQLVTNLDTTKDVYSIKFPNRTIRISILVALSIIAALTIKMHSVWDEAEISYRDGLAYMRLDREREYGVLAKKAVKVHPTRKRHSLYLGNYYIKRNDYRRAIEQYERLLEDYPYMIEPRQNLGIAYIETKQYKKADEVFKSWIEMQPSVIDAQISYAILNYKMGNLDKSAKHFRSAIRVYESRKQSSKKFNLKYEKQPWWKGFTAKYKRAKTLLSKVLEAKQRRKKAVIQ